MEKLRAQTQQSHTEADRYVAFVSAKNCTSTQQSLQPSADVTVRSVFCICIQTVETIPL